MRLKTLALVSLVLAAAAGTAWLLDWHERNRASRGMLGQPLVPGDNLDLAGVVLIESHRGQVTLRRTRRGWVVEEQDGFAADAVKLRRFLLHLTEVRIAQRVAASPDRLADLGLLQKVENEWRFEQGRTARVLSLIHGLEFHHKLIHRVLIGNEHPGGGTYVRFPVSNTVYLVAGDLGLDTDPRDWIRKAVFAPEFRPRDVRAVALRRDGGPAQRWRRASPQAAWRRLRGAGQGSPAAVARGLMGLRLAGVQAAGEVPPDMRHASAARFELELFDGRVYILAIGARVPGEPLRYGRLSAALRPRAIAARALARAVAAFNGRFGGRVVTLPGGRVRALLSARGPAPRERPR